MNKYDVAGVLQTYAEKVRRCEDKERVKELIKELRKELDLRKITED